MKQKVFTSICLPKNLKNMFDQCVTKLDINRTELLSVLCYKAGKFVCKKAKFFQTVEYQEKGKDYEIVPVYFFASDHEYMHANRLACKVSVSKLLSCAMVMFLDDIMEKGIKHFEIARLQIKNSYKKKNYFLRNFSLTINRKCQF